MNIAVDPFFLLRIRDQKLHRQSLFSFSLRNNVYVDISIMQKEGKLSGNRVIAAKICTSGLVNPPFFSTLLNRTETQHR